MVDWVNRRRALPIQRLENADFMPDATPAAPRKRDDAAPRVAAGMFSGSPEAEKRARAFDEHADDFEEEFAQSSNGSGGAR